MNTSPSPKSRFLFVVMPAALITVGLAANGVLITIVVPAMANMLERQKGAVMPALTEFVFKISRAIMTHQIESLLVAACVSFGAVLFFEKMRTKPAGGILIWSVSTLLLLVLTGAAAVTVIAAFLPLVGICRAMGVQ